MEIISRDNGEVGIYFQLKHICMMTSPFLYFPSMNFCSIVVLSARVTQRILLLHLNIVRLLFYLVHILEVLTYFLCINNKRGTATFSER